MATPVNPAAADSPRVSYSFSSKDTDGDGAVSFAEYMAPVAPGATAIVPADLSDSMSMEDCFKACDTNKDGKVTQDEMIAGAQSMPSGSMSTDLSDKLSYADAVLAYYKNRNADASDASAAVVRGLIDSA